MEFYNCQNCSSLVSEVDTCLCGCANGNLVPDNTAVLYNMNPDIQKWEKYVDISGTVGGLTFFISSGTPPDRDLTEEDAVILLSLAYENFNRRGPWPLSYYGTSWNYLLAF
jgi:hypothetical protein